VTWRRVMCGRVYPADEGHVSLGIVREVLERYQAHVSAPVYAKVVRECSSVCECCTRVQQCMRVLYASAAVYASVVCM
jgi:hypothetical protein